MPSRGPRGAAAVGRCVPHAHAGVARRRADRSGAKHGGRGGDRRRRRRHGLDGDDRRGVAAAVVPPAAGTTRPGRREARTSPSADPSSRSARRTPSRAATGCTVAGRSPAAASAGTSCSATASSCATACRSKRPDGSPATLALLVDAGQTDIEDTWRVLGLRGTCSQHFSLAETFVPDERTFDIYFGRPSIDGVSPFPIIDFICHIGTVAGRDRPRGARRGRRPRRLAGAPEHARAARRDARSSSIGSAAPRSRCAPRARCSTPRRRGWSATATARTSWRWRCARGRPTGWIAGDGAGRRRHLLPGQRRGGDLRRGGAAADAARHPHDHPARGPERQLHHAGGGGPARHDRST